MPIEKGQIAELIKDYDFRSQFTADFVHEFISAQIRALRDKMGWSQEVLGHEAKGMEQAQVSRLEDPDYSGGSLKSLIRLAQAFDVGLLVRFVPFSKLVDSTVDLTPDNLAPPNFNEEDLCRVMVLPTKDIKVVDANSLIENFINTIPENKFPSTAPINIKEYSNA